LSAPNRKDAEAAIAFVRRFAFVTEREWAGCTGCVRDAQGATTDPDDHEKPCFRTIAVELAQGFEVRLNEKPIRGPLSTAEKQLLVRIVHGTTGGEAWYQLPGDGNTGATVRTARRLERRKLVDFSRPHVGMTARGLACYSRLRPKGPVR
jgi:hypothetical protein